MHEPPGQEVGSNARAGEVGVLLDKGADLRRLPVRLHRACRGIPAEQSGGVYVNYCLAPLRIAAFANDKTNIQLKMGVMSLQYTYSKYVRNDNTPEYAKYLGYLDARELYPELKPKSFKQFVGDLVEGKVQRPYAKGMSM